MEKKTFKIAFVALIVLFIVLERSCVLNAYKYTSTQCYNCGHVDTYLFVSFHFRLRQVKSRRNFSYNDFHYLANLLQMLKMGGGGVV